MTTELEEFKVADYNGKLVTESRLVAEMIDKEHKHLMRDIREYIRVISESPSLDCENFFIEATYVSDRNRVYDCYLLTKEGCEMVGNKMTGEKGILFSATYVSKFNEMENELKSQHEPTQQQFSLPTTYKEALLQLVEQVEINEELQLKLETTENELKIAEPQADKYKTFLNSEGYMNGSQLAKFIGNPKFGRNKIYEFLKDQKIFMKNDNTPYQSYMSKGYFKVVYSEYGGGRGIPTTLFSPSGADYIIDLAREYEKIG